jgi:hypothetical protein
MARIAFVTRDAVADNEKAAFDAFLEPRGGQLNAGPYALLLHMPVMAQHLKRCGFTSANRVCRQS